VGVGHGRPPLVGFHSSKETRMPHDVTVIRDEVTSVAEYRRGDAGGFIQVPHG